MQFIPKKTKFKKQQKGKKFNKITKVHYLNQSAFGSIGLKSISFGRITSKQIETVRQSINKVMKKKLNFLQIHQ
jgi:large subunit ribosomal protein L16